MTDLPPRNEDNSPSLSRPSRKEHIPQLGGDVAILHLVECLASEEWEVRRAAAFRLAEIGDVRAIETLMTRLMLENNGDEREVKVLANIGMPALPHLATLLGHGNWHASYHAALSLVQLGDKGIAEAVILSHSDNPQIRWLAVLGLEEVGYPHNIPAATLIEALHVRHPFITNFAARMLGRMNDPAVVSQLRSLMNDENVLIHIRRLAAASLAFMGYTDGIELLVRNIAGGLALPWTVWQAMESLGEKAFPFLISELEREGERGNHMQIIQLLGAMKNPGAVPVVEIGLRNSDPRVRGEAAHCLGEYADPCSTKALFAALKDQYLYVQFAVARTLLKIATQEARAAVEQWRLGLPPDAQYRFDNGSIFG